MLPIQPWAFGTSRLYHKQNTPLEFLLKAKPFVGFEGELVSSVPLGLRKLGQKPCGV